MLPLLLLIGGIHYRVMTSCNDMGSVGFPRDDRVSPRVIKVCLEVDENQRRLVAEHELHHICYHNHEHNFATQQELDEHLNHKYTEEQSVDILSQCVVENRSAVYNVFEVK